MDTRILIIDDDPKIIDLISAYLRDGPFEANHAHSSEEALKLLETIDVDIIITDKQMPSPDGSDSGGMYITRKVRARYPNIEIILMTGYGSIETAIESLKAGAFDYLSKPFSKNELYEKLNKIIDYKKFINPQMAIPVYKTFHAEILKLIEKREDLNDPVKRSKAMKVLDSKIDHFFQAQKKCEGFIIQQLESLGRIAGFAEQLSECLPETGPQRELIDKIMFEANKRI